MSMTGAKPTRKCLSTETKTGLPCQEDVDVTRARCEHGHVCTTAPRAAFSVSADLDATSIGTLEIDELFGTAGPAPKSQVSRPDPVEAAKQLHPSSSPEAPPPATPFEVVAWAKAGATSVELVHLLRSQAITPQEVARLVVDEEGQEMTIISAIEQGKIPPYDAPAVCATYPGEGWRYDADRFCWERALPIHALARIVRTEAAGELARDPGDPKLAARLAAEIAKRSSDEIGIDLIIAKGSDTPIDNSWAEELPAGFLADCAHTTAEAFSSPDDLLSLYAARWLKGSQPGPQLEVVGN